MKSQSTQGKSNQARGDLPRRGAARPCDMGELAVFSHVFSMTKQTCKIAIVGAICVSEAEQKGRLLTTDRSGIWELQKENE